MIDDDEVTPNLRGRNGSVSEIAFEDTGRRNLAAMATGGQIALPSSGVNPLTQIAEMISAEINKQGNGNGGGVPPDIHTKTIKRHNWGSVLLALISAICVALGSYYATEARSKANESKIKKHDSKIDKNSDDVRFIKVRVTTIGETLQESKIQQNGIAAGIEELKKENVNRLKDELNEAKRENRTLRRRNR